jgi:hypothetical protein
LFLYSERRMLIRTTELNLHRGQSLDHGGLISHQHSQGQLGFPFGPNRGGSRGLASPTPYHTHQVIELPPHARTMTHYVLHQARCVGCRQVRKAAVPTDYVTGYGLYLTALSRGACLQFQTSSPPGPDSFSSDCQSARCRSPMAKPASESQAQGVYDKVSSKSCRRRSSQPYLSQTAALITKPCRA